MNSIIKRPTKIELYGDSLHDSKKDFPEIFEAQKVCVGDAFATTDDGSFVQLTHQEVKDMKYDDRPWDFKPMYAKYFDFMNSMADVDPIDKDYVLIFVIDPESFAALCQRLGLTPTQPSND